MAIPLAPAVGPGTGYCRPMSQPHAPRHAAPGPPPTYGALDDASGRPRTAAPGLAPAGMPAHAGYPAPPPGYPAPAHPPAAPGYSGPGYPPSALAYPAPGYPPSAPGYLPQTPVPARSGGNGGAVAGFVCGILAAVAYLGLGFLATFGASLLSEHTSLSSMQWGFLRGLWVLPPLVAALFVIPAVDTRLRSRTGTVLFALGAVGVVFAWNLLVALHLWLPHNGALRSVVGSEATFPVFIFVAVTLIVCAWFRARRRSAATLLLAPVAGLIAAVACWLLGKLEWRPAYTPIGNAVSDLVIYALPVVVVVVVFAWIGVLVDKLVAGNDRSAPVHAAGPVYGSPAGRPQ